MTPQRIAQILRSFANDHDDEARDRTDTDQVNYLTGRRDGMRLAADIVEHHLKFKHPAPRQDEPGDPTDRPEYQASSFNPE